MTKVSYNVYSAEWKVKANMPHSAGHKSAEEAKEYFKRWCSTYKNTPSVRDYIRDSECIVTKVTEEIVND